MLLCSLPLLTAVVEAQLAILCHSSAAQATACSARSQGPRLHRGIMSVGLSFRYTQHLD